MTQVFTVRLEGRFDPLVPKDLTRAIYRAIEYACDNDISGARALNWDDIDQFTVTHAEAAVPPEPQGPVTIEKCPCGHECCDDYHLVGIGKFVQGSGFTLEEATRIARLLNEED